MIVDNEQVLFVNEVKIKPCQCGSEPSVGFTDDMFNWQIKCRSCGKTIIGFDGMKMIGHWNREVCVHE